MGLLNYWRQAVFDNVGKKTAGFLPNLKIDQQLPSINREPEPVSALVIERRRLVNH